MSLCSNIVKTIVSYCDFKEYDPEGIVLINLLHEKFEKKIYQNEQIKAQKLIPQIFADYDELTYNTMDPLNTSNAYSLIMEGARRCLRKDRVIFLAPGPLEPVEDLSTHDSQRKDPVKMTIQATHTACSQKPKKSKEDYNINEKELQQEVSISEETISKIQTCMKNILQYKEEGSVKLYKSQGNHRVFELDTTPGLIFKMKASKNCHIIGRDNSMKARYKTMINAQTIVRTHQLELLVIPNAKLFSVNVEGEEHEIIAEQKVDINQHESAQEQYFQDYANSLNKTIRQLAVFICKTGYSDVEWRNIPILNNSLDVNGNRKIALIDIEEMDSQTTGLFGGGFWRRGLVRCVNEEQGKIVETIAEQNGVSTSSFADAYDLRKEELEEGHRLKKYYATKNIVAGDEPIQIDEKTLNFSAYPEKPKNLRLLLSIFSEL